MTSKELQTLKFGRLSVPEKIVLESFKGLKEYVYKDNTDLIYYKSDKGIFYRYDEKNGRLDYDYELIFLKVKPYFDNNSQKTNDFVRELVEKYLKLTVVTMSCLCSLNAFLEEKYLKLKVVSTTIARCALLYE